MNIKRDFSVRYNAPLAVFTRPHITLSSFVANGAWRHNIIHNLQTIAYNTRPFDVTLKDFGAFHPRTIYINVSNAASFAPLIQLLHGNKHTRRYICNTPHLTICRRLAPLQYKLCWPVYEHRKFRTSFTASGMLLLQKQIGHVQFKKAAYFKFNAKAPFAQQGDLF